MRVHFCEEDRFYLVAECKSDVTYIAQAGGIACNHPEIEGAIVCSSQRDEDGDLADRMCQLGCYGERLKPADVARANELLSGLFWGAFSEIRNLKIDETRLAECEEGWWCVTFDVVYPLRDEPTTHHRGVVCGPNCD